MKLVDLFPLIVLVLIVLVSLLRAIIKATGAAQKKQTGRERPSVWAEFKKALQSLAEEQRERQLREAEPHEGEQEEEEMVVVEEPPAPTTPEERGRTRERVIVVTPIRRSDRRRREPISSPVQPSVPQSAPAPTPHRPEELGSGIAREVSDIVHPAVEEHLARRGLVSETPGLASRTHDAVAMLHLIGASSADLRKAILLQEILSYPLADRMPGPMGLR